MALCAVCQAPCRGKCTKCGARLCALHKPASSRARCAICKQLGTGVIQAIQAIPPYPARTPKTTAPTPSGNVVPLAILAVADQLAWISTRRMQLLKKQARERAYLDRRAARGAHTPTDEVYEADAILETELLEALDLLERCLQGGTSLPLSASSGSTYAGDTSMLFPDPGRNAKIQP